MNASETDDAAPAEAGPAGGSDAPEAGLLEQTPDGRVRRCALNAQPLSAAFSWIVQYRLFWEDALDAIARRLET